MSKDCKWCSNPILRHCGYKDFCTRSHYTLYLYKNNNRYKAKQRLAHGARLYNREYRRLTLDEKITFIVSAMMIEGEDLTHV